jgi:hypothetical protein
VTAEADLDQVLHEGKLVILGADQRPFETSGQGGIVNTFCVLTPLMTIEGHHFPELPSTFPNRGRVWWMLTQQHKSYQVEPGAIFTAQLEHGVRWDASDPHKDRYQVRRQTMKPGALHWYQVLDMGGDVQDVADLMREGIPCKHPPTSSVVIEAGDSLYGPFKANWDPAERVAHLSATFAGDPKAYKIDTARLPSGSELVDHRYQANVYEIDRAPMNVRLRLVSEDGARRMAAEGEEIDAAADAQVVKWALELAGTTRKEQARFREALEKAQGAAPGSPGVHEARLRRFRHLCQDAELVTGLGVEVAEALAAQPAFEQLVKVHADDLAQREVERIVGQRTAEVEREIEALSKRREKLREEIGQIETDYDRLKADQEKRLGEDHAAWLRELEEREREVQERTEKLVAQEHEVESRLEGVIARYESAGQEIGDQLLAQLPVLRRLGLASGRAEELDTKPGESLRQPAWMDRMRTKGGLPEQEFLDQLQSVAERRALVFDADDLANYHVAVKSGLWTVLAGASGVGKSSLPRVYAEALGCEDEFLMVSVRPDWLDDRDVIGAFNPFVQRFEPAPTGLVERLIAAALDAQADRGGIYIVCLDEMNLARVEHYFAQFLSLMELPASRRKLRIYSRGVGRPNDPFAAWRQLPIGDNVRFVGTVNVDETTHFFSPKVLDRAPVLQLEPPDLSRPPARAAQASELGVTPVHFEEYRGWIRGASEAPTSVLEFLLDVDAVLRGIRSGMAYRLRDRILTHVASARGVLSEDRSLDFALAQCVLPRLRTGAARFGDVSGELARLISPERFPRAGALLQALREGGGEHDFFQLL